MSAAALKISYTAIQAEIMRREFKEFISEAWKIIEPGAPFVGNWHIDAIAEHLTYVSLGDIEDLIVNIPPRHSKALTIDTPVFTTHGWKNHGDLKIGDYVYAPDGQPRKVLATTPHKKENSFRVNFKDDAFVDAGEGHLWKVERDENKTPRYRDEIVVTTTQINCGSRGDIIPVCDPVNSAPQKLLIDPYVLGAWLGDGSSENGYICASELDVHAFLGYGEITHTSYAKDDPRKTMDFHRVLVDGLATRLRISNLLKNKHIPIEYLTGSIEQKWSLLQGLMDTDGHAAKDGTAQFANNNKRIIDGVVELVCSLGMRCKVDERYSMFDGKKHGPHYRVVFIPRPSDIVFRLKRKQEAMNLSGGIKTRRRYIKSVDSIGVKTVSCIQVEGEMYLVGKHFIPTHNSTVCSVLWPAWEWTHMPHTQWLCATYASTLTLRDSVKCRKLIQSPWYQERYGDIFHLSGDQNQKTRFSNDKNGYRIATSVGGTATGEGGDRILVDDAHNMLEIHSDVKRQTAINWWRDTMSTRGNNPSTLARVMIAQRGHHMDLPGYCLGNETWVHLNLAGYYRKKTHCRTVALKDSTRKPNGLDLKPLKKGDEIFSDPRTEEDELLNPKRFTQEAMQKIVNELTDMGFAAQIQQDPSVDGGNILKETSWRPWLEKEMPAIDMVVQVYDTAFEEGEENDFSARTTWGIFDYQEEYHPDNEYSWAHKGKTRRCAIVLERMEERLTFPDLVDNAKEAYRTWEPDVVLVEKKASGHSLIQEMKKAKVPVKKVKVTDSKLVRAHAAALTLDQGCIFYPEKKWAKALIKTCAEFPTGEFDDLVDTVTMLCLWLRKMGTLEYAGEDDDEMNLMDQFRKKKFY